MIPTQRILESRILVVDDQEDNVLLLEKLLDAAGYGNVLSATDPRQVLELHRSFRPDLILLDLNMPHLDGFQVMELLKLESPDGYLPILVLTADITAPTKLRALEAGARDFLTKPFDNLEVRNRIRNMLEVRLLYNELQDQNKVLERKVRERTRELHDTRLEIIHRLGRAAEFRDRETGHHILRISLFSDCLARAAGIPAPDSELILNASPMHDIGKIGIPDRILLKPDRLDEEEWRVMQTHTTIGAELLAGHDSALLRVAATIAISHHEKWDGTGYPKGLRGVDIPMDGRIVALCDVFDALISERSYKRRWALDDAIAEIDGQNGKAFDPDIVAAFHQALPQIRDIIARIETKASMLKDPYDHSGSYKDVIKD